VRLHPVPVVALLAVLLASMLTGCGSGNAKAASGVVRIVAAENFWGSIAAQIGGARVQVTSIIDNPNTDPHDYEPTPANARSIAMADLVIVNGVGYDGWADKLLSASPGARLVINVGDLVGAKDGDNPHRWYNPDNVHTFMTALTADLRKLNPSGASAYNSGLQTFQQQDLKQYDDLIAEIKAKYSGTPVGASESIFSMLAPSLGLDVITPARFLKAISEGGDVSAADKTTIDRQINSRQIKIYVYNTQNATPDIQAQLKECEAKGIPTATLTETLSPASATFEQWQSVQLIGIARALAQATGGSTP
jgi:zinc/manganese transport system substrate-binding protein